MLTIPNKGKEDAEARILIDFAKEEANLDHKELILLIKDLILRKQNFRAKYWNWKIIDYIEQKTGAILIDNDFDVNTEIGDWGIPVTTGHSQPIGYEIKNEKYLIKLFEYLDEEINNTFIRITNYFVNKDKTKWTCQKCGRYLGQELNDYKKIQKLLIKFNLGHYWKCRSCKEYNWFEIDTRGFIHFLS